MPPNTFEAEIFSFPHTYTKLTFGTAGIKNLIKLFQLTRFLMANRLSPI